MPPDFLEVPHPDPMHAHDKFKNVEQPLVIKMMIQTIDHLTSFTELTTVEERKAFWAGASGLTKKALEDKMVLVIAEKNYMTAVRESGTSEVGGG